MILADDILIGTWLRGEHLDDLPHVESKYLRYPDVVESMKKGIPTMRIINGHRDRMKLIEWTTVATPALYEQSFNQLIDIQIKEAIKQETDLNKVYQMIADRNVRFARPVESYKDYGVSFAEEMARREHQETVKWSDMPSLQEITVGIKRKELTSIAARPSVGKSAFALQIAFGAWKQGAKVLYFPLEMSAQQTFGRILIREELATTREIQTGKFEDPQRIQLGADMLTSVEDSGRFLIYEGEGRIEEIERLIEREQPYLVVIDQLTQMKSNKAFKDIRSQFSYMTSNLKRITMQHDVAILLLCQINRNADNIRPTMANLKESGSIEEDSDNVILLHRFRRSDDGAEQFPIDWNTQRAMEINLAKQRDGETGRFAAIFMPSKMFFFEPTTNGGVTDD